ncbi:hypothetical protein U9R90_18700 [Streptomyces sp. E11-3]|uniref:hypothetical protein n=1 Tax=Streptomyces sp. E11-3 TaxID=3110112 RepID=UPI00397F17F6
MDSHTDAERLPALPLDDPKWSPAELEPWGQVDEAKARLTQECMRRRGFDDFPLHPAPAEPIGDDPAPAVATGMSFSSRFHPTDPGYAKRWGYGYDPDASRKSMERYLREEKAKNTGRPLTPAEDDAEYSCRPESSDSSRLTKGVSGTGPYHLRDFLSYIDTRKMTVAEQAEKDPELKEAFASWSVCMTDKGQKAYESPGAAGKYWRDKQSKDMKQGALATSTAIADVECKFEHNTIGIWWHVLKRHEEADLKRHKDRYGQVRKDMDAYLSNARAVLEKS